MLRILSAVKIPKETKGHLNQSLLRKNDNSPPSAGLRKMEINKLCRESS